MAAASLSLLLLLFESLGIGCKPAICMSYAYFFTQGPITWAGLAWFAKITFGLVLHGPSQPGAERSLAAVRMSSLLHSSTGTRWPGEHFFSGPVRTWLHGKFSAQLARITDHGKPGWPSCHVIAKLIFVDVPRSWQNQSSLANRTSLAYVISPSVSSLPNCPFRSSKGTGH